MCCANVTEKTAMTIVVDDTFFIWGGGATGGENLAL